MPMKDTHLARLAAYTDVTLDDGKKIPSLVGGYILFR
jgi:hypothetical protein